MEHVFNRGEIKHQLRAKQLHSFEGLIRRRGITPTDIDGVIEYTSGKAFVLIEGKTLDAPFPKGQKQALESMADKWQESGSEAILILFQHTVPVDEIVIVATQKVTDYYYQKAWHKPVKDTTVLEAIEFFEHHCQRKNIYL